MFNDILEFLFCPVHGLIRMETMPWLGASVAGYNAACWRAFRKK